MSYSPVRRTPARAVMAATLLVTVNGLAPCAYGYVLTGRSWPQAELGAPVTISYSYSNLLDGGLVNASDVPLPQQEVLTAVEEAFSVWAAVAPLHFVEVEDEGGNPPRSNYAAGQYGTIRLGHRPIDRQGNVKAIAYFPPTFGQSSACTICGDVHFDSEEQWETVGTLELPDLLGAAIHEVGHALGLGHTSVREANMYPVFRRHTGPGSGWLHPDDIAGIQAIYGPGLGSVSPLVRVPEPASGLLLSIAAMLSLAWHRRRRSIQTAASAE